MLPIPVNRIEGQTFVGANVQVDAGCAYIKCKFVNCNLVFTGNGVIQFEATTIENCRWAFAGAAGNTISFLKNMYAQGDRQMVEGVLREIRGEAHFSVPPSGETGSVIQ